MFHVLGVSGSPRQEGNTELLINAALSPFVEEGHDIHRFFLSGKRVAPCTACDACAADGVCVVDDDYQEFREELFRCDAMIVGSPVYSRNCSAQLLALFNRNHCISLHRPTHHERPFQDKICFGGAIAVGGSPNSQGITLTVIHNLLLSLGVCCVPAVQNGVSAVAREKGAVLSQPKSLGDAKILGENILRVLKIASADERRRR
jgi:multimeric flavodoxin WrbA